MSDIEGEKPKAFKRYAVKNKLGFLAIEYSGHGKSSGEFTRGNISEWSNDVTSSIKKIVKKNWFILIGSSMGAWISLNQFKYFKNQIKGFVGIGSAPEFLEKLMWKKFPKKIRQEIISRGISIIKILPLVKNATVTMAENSMQNPIIIVFFSPQIFIAGLTKTP